MWPQREMRARIRSLATTWFSPSRWSHSDMVIAVAALVLAVSVFLPWFKAVVRLRNSDITGYLIDPPGNKAGIAAHEFLWLAFGLAMLQFVVLAARYVPGRRALKTPGYHQFLVVISGLSLAAVLVGFAFRPSPWYGKNPMAPIFTVSVGWNYGALIGLAAAVVSLAVGISAMRDEPRR
jgi:hypothetical protein